MLEKGEQMLRTKQNTKKLISATTLAIIILATQSVARADDQSSGCGMGWKVAPAIFDL